MSNAWTGLDAKARKIKNIYVGVNNKAKKVLCAWVGVNGIAKYAYPEQIAIPTVSGTYTYTGNVQSAVVNYDSDNVVLSNTTATNAGTYTITAHLKYDYLRWADGSKTDKQIPWTIAKKVLDTPTPKYTFYYTGRDLGAILFRPRYWNVYCDYSNEISVTNYTSGSAIGTYSVTFTINNNNYIFSGNKTSVTTSYTINKTHITLRYANTVTSRAPHNYYEGDPINNNSYYLIPAIQYNIYTEKYKKDTISLYVTNDSAIGYSSLNDTDYELSRIYLPGMINDPWGWFSYENYSMYTSNFEKLSVIFTPDYYSQKGEMTMNVSFPFAKPTVESSVVSYGYFTIFRKQNAGEPEALEPYSERIKAPCTYGVRGW